MNNRIVDSKLRFPKFKNKWEFIKFKKYIKLYRGSSPRPIHEYLSYGDGVNWIKIGDTKNCVNYKISSTEEKITYAGAEKSRYVNSGELILANSMTYGKAYLLEISGCIYDGWFVLRDYEQYFDKRFLLYQLNSDILQKQYQKLSAGGIVLNISSDIVYQTNIFHTSIEEQQKIAECLNSIDELIAGEEDKLKELKNHKNGLLQKLFPKNNSSNPELRFPEFKEDWVKTNFEKLLKYERPDKYIVDNTNYNIEGTPVLTANKAFILGYTDENFGIYTKLPVIIFDDFTVDKKYVEFPFKVKSSAIKILKPKFNDNLKFIYELMRTVKFSADEHKRYYISTYQYIDVFVPQKIEEQNKIAECLNSIDELISAQTEKIEALKLHKKGLMQGLFPSLEEVKDEQ